MTFSQFNIDIFRAINDLGKQYSFLNSTMVFLAEYMVYILALIILAYWFTGPRKSRMMVIQAMFAFVLAEVIGKITGKFHLNYQPFAVLPDVNKLVDHAVDNSFPSDHTMFSYWLVPNFSFINQLLTLYERVEKHVLPSKKKSKGF
ncbi:undecaprenyl-diphosphatase [Bacillus wiedmannii]|uniref:undecaprenyl-diphosphatase n=1 Tax=Bacillus wiedmannii TaxID=1890302 RepID=UPI001F0916A3|nr:undecaprenyl-diphosphatase [Bacillus wiedmannii]MCX3313641.1 undecaprenyl-diphosphatase [Bacillus wiedmannii]